MTLLHYDFIAVEDEKDTNVLDGTKSIDELFQKPPPSLQAVQHQPHAYSPPAAFLRPAKCHKTGNGGAQHNT